MKVNYSPIIDNRYNKSTIQNKSGNMHSHFKQRECLSNDHFNSNFFIRGISLKGSKDESGKPTPEAFLEIGPSVSKLNTQLYEARMEYIKSASSNEFPPYNIAATRLNKTQFEIAKAIRWEYPVYTDSLKKMRQGEPLNSAENKFIGSVLKSLTPIEKDVTLYRAISDFPGLQEQLKSGTFTDATIMSTSKTAEGWIDFWSTPKRDYATGKITKQSYVLRLSVPKGTPVLDLGGSYKKLFGKQVVASGWSNEVVLPPNTRWEVGKINKDLGIIDLKLISDNTDTDCFPRQLP